MTESSWLATMFQALAGEEGWTLVEPPTMVRPAPPRALASWYARRWGPGLPSSAIASACPVEKIRFLRVSPPTRRGVKRWRNSGAMGHSMDGSGRPVNGPAGGREGLLRRALARRHHRALRHEAADRVLRGLRDHRQCTRHGRPLRGARAAMMRRPHPASAARLVPPEAMRPQRGPSGPAHVLCPRLAEAGRRGSATKRPARLGCVASDGEDDHGGATTRCGGIDRPDVDPLLCQPGRNPSECARLVPEPQRERWLLPDPVLRLTERALGPDRVVD